MQARFVVSALLCAFLSSALFAQAAPSKKPATHPAAKPMAEEHAVVTHHQISVGGRTIAYTATAGNLILKTAKGAPEVSVFYVAYTEDGADRTRRPVTFLYNGGPGAATVFLHMGAFGPRRIAFPSDAKPNAGPPYPIVDNQNTLLDKSDLVFIDAPGTGYSQVMPGIDNKAIFGLDQDAAAFGQFIRRYVTLNDRWNSPKFLLGESYGTPRSAMLVDYLQNNDNMAFNGVTLLSSVLDFDTVWPGPGNDLAFVTYVPTEAAVNWYHSKAADKGSLQSVVNEARTFANGPYTQALMQGDRLPHDQFVQIASQLSHLIGLSQQYVEQADLRVLPWRYAKELMRESGQTAGRLDARYVGYDLDALADSADYDPSGSASSPGFQAGFLAYLRNELNYKSDEEYKQLSTDVFPAWDWTRKSVIWLAPTTSPDLQDAMTTNPRLHVFVGCGYFDMATPFGAAEWTFSHMGLQPELRSHVTFGYYPSGHMVYMNQPSITAFHADLDKFYDATLAP